jgi:protein O-GlcNAc transferase
MANHHIVRLFPLLVGLTLLAACRRDLVSQGLRALEKGDPARAQALLQQAIERDPQDPSAAANLGLAYLRQSRTNEALNAFRQAADLAPEDPRPLEFMAAIAAGQEQWKTAAGYLAEAVRRDPRSPRVQTALAVAELQSLSPQAARIRLEAVLEMAPNYSPAVFNLAVINRQLKSTPEAKALFQRYLRISRDAEHVALARSALADFESAGHPSANPPGTLPTSRERPSTPGPTPAARGASTGPAASPVPDPVPRRPQVAAQAYNLGVRNHMAGDLNRAIQEYSRAVQNDPTMVNAHYNLGLVFKARNDLARARSAFQQALALSPDMPDARYMLALVLRDLREPNACIVELKALLEKHPKYAAAHHALGQLYKNDPATVESAKREFSRYLELAPDGPSAREARNWLKYNP